MAKNKQKKNSILNTGRFDSYILLITIILVIFGLVVLMSASAPTALAKDGDSYSYFRKQTLAAAAGFVLMLAISRIDYRIFKRIKWLKWFIYIGFLASLFAVGVWGIGEYGAKRWFRIPGFSVQPSEFAKVGFLVFFAAYISDLKDKEKIGSFLRAIIIPMALCGLIFISLYVVQNHFSAAAVIVIITGVQLFTGGVPLRDLAVLGISGISLGYVYMTKKGNFRASRIDTWLNPSKDLTGKAYQINQSLYAIGSGGPFGVGLGNSKQKYLYLPFPQNDFIFSVLAEELGFVGCIFVIILFALFIWRGLYIAMKAENDFGKLIAVGVTVMIGIQAIVNIAVVTNSMPVTGMTLPFFSYGGSAMIADLAAVGFLLSVSKDIKKKRKD